MSAIHEQEHEQNSFLPALHNNDHPRSNSEDYGLFDEVVQHENRTAEIKTHPSETQDASVVVGEQNNVKEEEEEENLVTSGTSNRRMNDDMSSLESESFCEVCSSDERSNNDGVLPVRHYKMESRFDCNICLESVEEPVVTRCGHLYCWSCLYKWLEPGILPNESPFYYHSSSSSGGLIGRTSTTDEDTFVSPALVMGDDDQGADASQQTSQYAATTQQQHQVQSSSRNNILPTTGTRQAIEIDHTRRCCPVCKAECTVPSLVPIYVREEPSTVVHGNNMKSKKRTNNTNTLRKRIIRKDIINAEDSQQARANNTPTTSSNSPHRDTSSRGRSSGIPSRPHPSNIIRFNRPTMNATNTSPSYAFHHQDTTSISRGAGAGGIRSSFDMSLMPVLLGLHPPPRHHQGMMGNPHGGGDDYNIMRSFSDVTPGTTGYTTTLSDEEWLREDAATSFLSRLLLMLFTFVILVLLFF